MKPIRLLIVILCLTLVMSSQTFCQSANAKHSDPLLSQVTQLPPVFDGGLVWPAAEELSVHAVPTDPQVLKDAEKTLTRSLKSSIYNPKKVDLIPLKNWPNENVTSFVQQFLKDDCRFYVRCSQTQVWISIKRTDGQEIWDMSKDPGVLSVIP